MAACGALLLALLLMHWPTTSLLMVACTEDPEKTQPQGTNQNAANHQMKSSLTEVPPLDLKLDAVDHSQLTEEIVINEINAETLHKTGAAQFIELRFTDPCLFQREVNQTGLGPKLDNYYGFIISYNGTANTNKATWNDRIYPILPVIQASWNFTGFTFSNDSELFLISRDNLNPDFKIPSVALQVGLQHL